MRLFRKRCQHKWEQKDIVTVQRESNDNIVAWIYILQCSECGDVKEKRIDI